VGCAHQVGAGVGGHSPPYGSVRYERKAVSQFLSTRGPTPIKDAR